MRRMEKHTKKADLDWLDRLFAYINKRKKRKEEKTGSVKLFSDAKNTYIAENGGISTSEPDDSRVSEDKDKFNSGEYRTDNIAEENFSENNEPESHVTFSENNKDATARFSGETENDARNSDAETASDTAFANENEETSVVPSGKLAHMEFPADKLTGSFSGSGLRKKSPSVTDNTAVKDDSKPLWEKNPEKYRKKRSFFIRMLGGIWSFILFWILTGGVIGIIGLGTGVTLLYSFSDPELDAMLANLELDATTQILAYNSEGEITVYEELHSTENRVWVSINEMPQALLDATVAIEDKRFYKHMGFDPIRTTSATIQYIVNKLKGGSGVGSGGGGSTITQQLIKNITEDNEVSGWEGIIRKFKEILRAFYIERKYSKEQILEYYINTIPYGNGCDGIYTAAKYYFSKDVSELTMTECAALISITNSPTYYDPYKNPDNNYKRRVDTLYNMWDQGYISEEEYIAAKDAPLVLRDRSVSTSTSSVRSYFSDLVFEWTVNELMEQKGYSRAYAINYIYTAGLRIYTTVDVDIQRIMDDYFSNEDNYVDKDSEIKAQVAMEVLDPKTGNILGVIGGRGEKTADLLLNRVTQTKRPPGSAIKPITVYGQAIERNLITEATAIDDSPLYVEAKSANVSTETYGISGLTYTEYTSWPLNYDRTYHGVVDVKIALSNSYNTPAVKILQMVGVEESYNFAKNMLGLTSLVDADMNLAPLGVGSLTYGVTLQELTSAYTVFANGGIYSSPRCVTRIETFDGKTVLVNDVDRSIVFTPQTAYIMTDILMRTVTGGSSAVANLSPIATAAKSGTTSNFNDRWFIGYTPYYLAGIWWGYDTPQTNENTWHVQMWHDVMQQIHELKGITEATFTMPDGLVKASYCSVSGMAPGPYCSSDPLGSTIKTGIFKSGTQPTQTCDVHHQIYVCSVSGQIAHDNCPNAYPVTFRDISRSYKYGYVYVADAEYVCPPLDSNQILYNSTILPVYTYMIPEGEYPCLSPVAKKTYVNCLCQVHTPSATPHPYTYKFTHSGQSSSGDEQGSTDEEEYSAPEALPDPDELAEQQSKEQLIEIATQVFEQTGQLIDGVTKDMLFPPEEEETTPHN